MTQKQKELLLKDLCGRLPYGVVIQEKCVEYDKTFLPNKEVDRLVSIDVHANSLMTNCGSWYYLDEIKPYLFPLSSMTEEQKQELTNLVEETVFQIVHSEDGDPRPQIEMDWYNKNHFDYRGLIPMGLANDATGLNIY